MWQRNLIIHYSLFFLQFIKKIGLFIIFQALNIHYTLFLAHYSLFIIKKGHYSLIIIPHPDPQLSFEFDRKKTFYTAYLLTDPW